MVAGTQGAAGADAPVLSLDKTGFVKRAGADCAHTQESFPYESFCMKNDMNRISTLSACLLLCSLGLSCADPQPPADPIQKPNEIVKEDQPQPAETNTEPAVQVVPVEIIANTPDAAVRSVIEQLQNNQLTGLWEFLPASYQKDLNALVHKWAREINPERWQQVVAVMQNSLKLLQTRKAIILENLDRTSSLTEQQYDEMVALLESLFNGELADLEALQKIDVGTFLQKNGGPFLQHLSSLSELSPENPWQKYRQQWDQLQIDVLKADANNALLQFRLQNDPESLQQVPFVKVENKWIPLTLARNWESMLSNLRMQLASEQNYPKETQQKLAANQTALLNAINQSLAKLQAADTAAEFAERIQLQQRSVQTLLAERRNILSDEKIKPKAASTEIKSVTVVVQSALNEKAERELVDALLPLVDDPKLAIATVEREKDKTRIELSPVNHLARFTERITFTRVAATDDKHNSITLTWPPAATEQQP